MSIELAIEQAAKLFEGKEKEFFFRCWKNYPQAYAQRLKAIGFSGLSRVLDAGCGMGQWSVTLAQLNSKVDALDFSLTRVEATRLVVAASGLNNVNAIQGSIEELPYPNNTFDGLYCYLTLMLTDFEKSLKEFSRVLKPGGKLYLQGTGIGYFLFQAIEAPNQSVHYDSRQTGIEVIANSMDYFSLGLKRPGVQISLPSKLLVQRLSELGFSNFLVAGDGKLNVTKNVAGPSFYDEKYYGEEGIYEILATRSVNIF